MSQSIKLIHLFVLLFAITLVFSCSKEPEDKTNLVLDGWWKGEYSNGWDWVSYTFHFYNNTDFKWVTSNALEFDPSGCGDTTEVVVGIYKHFHDTISLDGIFTLKDFSTPVNSCSGAASIQMDFPVTVITPDSILLDFGNSTYLPFKRL